MPALLDRDMHAKKRQGGPGRLPDPKPERAPGARTPPAELRYGTRTVDSLRETRETTARVLAELDAALSVADELGLEVVALDGVTKGDRGLELLKGFVSSVIAAVQKQRMRRL